MSWKRLTIDDVRISLSEDELKKLGEISVKLDDVIQDTIDSISDAFRAAWGAKGYSVDVREHYIDSGYKTFVLAMVRWNLWTRFPRSDDYALSEPRKLEYEQALELLKDPYLATSTPDYSTDPELSDTVVYTGDEDITVPYLRFQSFPYSEGFYYYSLSGAR